MRSRESNTRHAHELQPVPFNNSVQTISLTKKKTSTVPLRGRRLISATGGSVGNFRVTDKLLNGFKLAFDGGATSVSVICRVKGRITAAAYSASDTCVCCGEYVPEDAKSARHARQAQQ